MANWCNNTVVFEGKPEAIEQINELFRTMIEQEKKEVFGQLPDFVENKSGRCFFEIYESDTAVFSYQTRWSPNTEILQQIAEHYNVNFTQDYEELGCLVYGRATFSDKLLTDIYLADEDFEKYQFDEEKDKWYFEGETYESDYEILETLLERKIENQFNNLKIQNDEANR
jgi:hypothetical protein